MTVVTGGTVATVVAVLMEDAAEVVGVVVVARVEARVVVVARTDRLVCVCDDVREAARDELADVERPCAAAGGVAPRSLAELGACVDSGAEVEVEIELGARDVVEEISVSPGPLTPAAASGPEPGLVALGLATRPPSDVDASIASCVRPSERPPTATPTASTATAAADRTAAARLRRSGRGVLIDPAFAWPRNKAIASAWCTALRDGGTSTRDPARSRRLASTDGSQAVLIAGPPPEVS